MSELSSFSHPAVRKRRRRSRWSALRACAWLALLFGALWLAVWRQTAGLQLAEQLAKLEEATEIAELERLEATRRLGELESRERITQAAAALGMRLPAGDEIVFLPVPTGQRAGEAAP
ncbi:MAG: hypothetical protein ACREKN_02245 [Longimicrobiaceae bacterium]